MTVQQLKIPIGQANITAGGTVSIELPKAHYLGALEIHLDAVVDVSSGSVTVVDSTLGPIPLIEHIQLRLDGRTLPIQLSGEFLDYWSHIDRPGSERLAISSTTDAAEWDAVLRYELAQSIANLTGALKLSDYASARLEIKFAAVSAIATGTGVAVSGHVDIYGEIYDETKTPPSSVDRSVVHTLSMFTTDIVSTGEKVIKLTKGRALERLIIVAENNSAYTWALLSRIALRGGPGDTAYEMTTPMFRAEQLRSYGGDDIPIVGVYVLDFRKAGSRDLIPLGDRESAPEPELVVTVPSGTSLTSAKVHIIAEELEPVAVPMAA